MKRSTALQEVIAGWFKAAESGDASWRDRHVSRDPDLRIVGTDPEEWLSGAPAYAFLKDEAATVGGKLRIKVHDLEAFEEGSIGWGVARPEITLADGTRVAPRWSGVFRQEDGDWRLIQLHASIAVGNAEAFGDTFASVPR